MAFSCGSSWKEGKAATKTPSFIDTVDATGYCARRRNLARTETHAGFGAGQEVRSDGQESKGALSGKETRSWLAELAKPPVEWESGIERCGSMRIARH